MDVALTLEGLMSDYHALLEENDFEGAEAMLTIAIETQPSSACFLHFQLGQLYQRWNKMTSAIHHLNFAATLAHQRSDTFLLIQIREALKSAKKLQAAQRP